MPPGEPMHTYDALQTAGRGRLRQLHRTYVPFSVLVGAKHEDQASPPAPHLYTALADLGHELNFTEYLRTRMPLPDQAEALRLSDGAPLLHILRVTTGNADKLLALEEFQLPGDNLEISYTLFKRPGYAPGCSKALDGGAPFSRPRLVRRRSRLHDSESC
ncbi:UTRA domain-containing protein [Streptomyces decoyicus]|uniref:UTRA domain-containing protein n=1 Tax=Streptomyces decoyicus TaxID=249567 RepID=UPI00399A4EB7